MVAIQRCEPGRRQQRWPRSRDQLWRSVDASRQWRAGFRRASGQCQRSVSCLNLTVVRTHPSQTVCSGCLCRWLTSTMTRACTLPSPRSSSPSTLAGYDCCSIPSVTGSSAGLGGTRENKLICSACRPC